MFIIIIIIIIIVEGSMQSRWRFRVGQLLRCIGTNSLSQACQEYQFVILIIIITS